MLKWPFRTGNAMGAYELNEQGDGGYYPVGLNNMWHSGIHLSSFAERPIYPLLNGKLVDHRISDNYKEIDKKEKITEKTWETLSYAEQTHYQQKTSLFGNITYELEGDCKEKDLYSNNFVLMSHEIVVNASKNEKIKFYTLYMNLAPYNYEEYVDIDINNSNLKIPFYQEWKFQVKPKEDITATANRYIGYSKTDKNLNSDVEVFEGSSFSCENITIKESIKGCNFVDSKLANVTIPLDHFDITGITIEINKDLPVYREGMAGENETSVGTINEAYSKILNTGEFEILKNRNGTKCYLKYLTNSGVINYEDKKIDYNLNEEYIEKYTNVYNDETTKEHIYIFNGGDNHGLSRLDLSETAEIKIYANDAFNRRVDGDKTIFTTYIQEKLIMREIDITEYGISELQGRIKSADSIPNPASNFKSITGMQEYEYVSGSTFGEPISVLKPDDEFAMCNGDDDFFLNSKDDESKDAIVIQRYNGKIKTNRKTVVKMNTIPKGNVKVKSVPSIGNMMEARKELTTSQCLGFPGPLSYHSTSSEPLDRALYNGIYDLVLILEKDLPDVGKNLDFTFLNDKLYKRNTKDNGDYENYVDLTAEDDKTTLLSIVENGNISNIIEIDTSDEYVKLSDFDYYYKRDKTSACAWENFFQKPTEEPSLESGDIVCNNRKLIESINRKKTLMINYESDGTTPRDDRLTRDEMKIVFSHFYYSSGEAAEIRSGMRKLICQHPLEWNSTLYSDIRAQAQNYGVPISGGLQTRMQNAANATDIWGKLSEVLKTDDGVKIADENNCLWFAHPIYFVNHLKREGLLDFNPYVGKVLKVKYAEFHDYKEIEVKSCPGFAPVYKEGTMAEYDYTPDLKTGDVNVRFYEELRDTTNSNYRWARLSCVFGYSWGYFNNTKDHTGIDLGGLDGSPIISMITGVVWATTWEGDIKEGSHGYGKLMIIKDMNNDLLYLLAHLSEYKKKVDEYVYPGETVALVGNTGGSFGAHLHLEVFVCDAPNTDTGKKSVFAIVENSFVWNRPSFDRKAKRRNPLDHSEKQAKE